MKDVKSSMVQVWCIIANALTNTGRANESSPNSKDNLALIDNFSTPVLGRCGWSSDFPAIIVSMKNWFFEKGHDTVYKDAGCTAQEYILKEMEERAKTLQRLVDAVKNAKNEQLRAAELELQNYREIFCDAKGELNKLTLANAYWVDSGHQRLEWVFIPARLKWLTMKDIADKANAEAMKIDPKFVPAEFATFDTTIPAKIREYTNYDEIVDTQYRGNNDAANQNRLTWKDYTKAAYRRIGAGTVPKVSESEFRAGGGEGPRRGYQYAR
ncbi:MAG: hypothetical protein KGI50_08105, partial [Patescibacteria group bacterium]|nr:hypothetical protein [Patescibacteria group bacterium]